MLDEFHSLLDQRRNPRNYFEKELSKLIQNVEDLVSLFKACDPLEAGRSFETERQDFTVQEKKDLILSKLYALRRTKRMWPVRLILLWNDITPDDENEVEQLITALKKSDFIETGEYGLRDLAKITIGGKTQVEKNTKRPAITATKAIGKSDEAGSELDIFISHSSKDKKIAAALIELIRSALSLSPKKIRCSSVDGYRLTAGAGTDEQLRNEVNSCEVLVGLITANSVRSAYVMFELGARWGQQKPMIPLLYGGEDLLEGPLSGINALRLDVPAQMHQFISDLAAILKQQMESPAVYIDLLKLLTKMAAIY